MSGGRILGEAENLSPGITGSFSLTLAPGRYRLVCTGGRSGTLVATGKAVAGKGVDLRSLDHDFVSERQRR